MPFGSLTAGVRRIRRYPADYLAVIGFLAPTSGRVTRVTLPILGGTATSVDLGLFAQKPGGGAPEPGLLLATATILEGIPPTAQSEGIFPVFTVDIGGEGSETAPFPQIPLTIAKEEASTTIPSGVTFTYEAFDMDNALLGVGEVRVKFVSHRAEEVAETSREFYFLTGVLGPRLGPAALDEQLEGEPFDGKGGVPHDTGTWTAVLEHYDPPPDGTVHLFFTQTSGGPALNCSAFNVVPSVEELMHTVTVAPVEGKTVASVAGKEMFLGLIPRGGNLELPVTRLAGGGVLRHNAAGTLADNPVVSGVAEGGAGEDGGCAAFLSGRAPIPGLL